MVFTSGCSDLDLIQSEVLATTARQFEFTQKIIHLVYGCTSTTYIAFTERKNPANRVQTYLVSVRSSWKEDNSSIFTYGEATVTTTIHAQVLHNWMNTASNFYYDDKENRYIALVDSDSIFTKKLEIRNLFKEADEVKSPKFFAQDAAWYMPRKQPLTELEQRKLLKYAPFLKLGNLSQVKDWRLFGGRGPFVVEHKTLLTKILPAAAEIWPVLPLDKKQLVFPIAAAHHGEPMAISGALMIHHYISRYENWDFADYIKKNPCESGFHEEDRALDSFPISIRAKNFTLPVWIDGRAWNFIDSQIPPDFFDCDAWLLREPSEKFWVLASTTKGYEYVSTILRRRHAVGVIIAIRAYNDVARIYRGHFCPNGYNSNKQISMGYNSSQYTTALPYTVGRVTKPDQGDNPLWKEKVRTEVGSKSRANALNAFDSEDVHFVFSTTCDSSQHWQSRLLSSSFVRVKQLGRLTRIVSGCDEASLRGILKKEPLHPRIHLHVTQNYTNLPAFEDEKTFATLNDSFSPYNKPFGIRHWLKHANPPVLESIIVLIDPDFIFLQPLLLNSNVRVTSASKVSSGDVDDMEVLGGLRQYKRFYVYEGNGTENASLRVRNGAAIGQRHTSRIKFEELKAKGSIYSKLCPNCNLVDEKDAMEFHSVGSPYILLRKNLASMIDDYCFMAVRLHEEDPTTVATELDAYVLASMIHGIRHSTFNNLALSSTGSDNYPQFVSFIGDQANPCSPSDSLFVRNEMPVMLHSMKAFTAVDASGSQWLYSERSVPSDLFECDSWLLSQPPSEVWTIARDSKSTEKMIQAYGLCTFVKAANQAITEYKSEYCSDGYNDNKRLRLLRWNDSIV
uniref:Uncharacterized protein AlNc14C34G3073 n=1 Tax=Albugo laibachii Nc14 TaxID=890382 RepID=F0W8E3_9STRA|nr:conserved hypothetical protein [Albugo laibachii Nc14]|eukprot:CCA17398.1 conserved hypothetical protein [Albugo laibachii Nc14]